MSDEVGIAEKMLAALNTLVESANHLEYLQGQIGTLTKEEMAKEEADRMGNIRLNVSTTLLNGILCGRTPVGTEEAVTLAIQYADSLIARLGVARSTP